jgi:uridylate kinase
MATTRYKRVLLKLSGGAFSGEKDYGIDASTLTKIARQIKQVIAMGWRWLLLLVVATSGVGLRLNGTE